MIQAAAMHLRCMLLPARSWSSWRPGQSQGMRCHASVLLCQTPQLKAVNWEPLQHEFLHSCGRQKVSQLSTLQSLSEKMGPNSGRLACRSQYFPFGLRNTSAFSNVFKSIGIDFVSIEVARKTETVTLHSRMVH